MWPQNIVPSRLYVGVKGYAADCTTTDTTNFLAKNGLACGRVYGFAVPTTATATPGTRATSATGPTTPSPATSRRPSGSGTAPSRTSTTTRPGTSRTPKKTDASGPEASYKFWTAKGRDAGGAKTEHSQPRPRGGNRFIQGSTAGYMGIYDFTTGVSNSISGLTAPALPNSIAATYTIVEGESKISDRIELRCKGKRADGNDQTMMKDKSADKDTFEDIDGLEWIAAANNKDYIVIQEDGGNKFGERMFLAEIPAAGVKPTYKFIAQAGGSRTPAPRRALPSRRHRQPRAPGRRVLRRRDLSGILKEGTATGGGRRAAEATVSIEDKYIAVGLQHHAANGGVISSSTSTAAARCTSTSPTTSSTPKRRSVPPSPPSPPSRPRRSSRLHSRCSSPPSSPSSRKSRLASAIAFGYARNLHMNRAHRARLISLDGATNPSSRLVAIITRRRRFARETVVLLNNVLRARIPE